MSATAADPRPLSEVDVYLDEGPGQPVYVGVLTSSYQGGRNLASASFQYDRNYLARADRYALSPDLPLVPTRIWTGTNTNLFGAFADASPDAWGQKLVEANNAVLRKHGAVLPQALGDFDFLLGVSDNTRMGALRLAAVEASHVTTPQSWLGPDASPETEVGSLTKTLRIAARYEAREASDEEIEYLAGIATSPGGARPKANVWGANGQLSLLKLPHSKDGNVDVEGWEAVLLTIAGRAGLQVPQFSVHRASEAKSVLVLDRFDRRTQGAKQQRHGYISAATALGLGKHDENSSATYEQFAQVIIETTKRSDAALREMYGRIALTVLANNVDDHWRNHGFIRVDGAWQLAPLFDVNPNPRRGVVYSRAISGSDDPRNRDIRSLHAIADAYKLSSSESAEIIAGVAAQVRNWPEVARELGIPSDQFDEMSAAFDETQLELAGSLPRA